MKYDLIQRKQDLAGGTLSDHAMLLRVYQLWQVKETFRDSEARTNGDEFVAIERIENR